MLLHVPNAELSVEKLMSETRGPHRGIRLNQTESDSPNIPHSTPSANLRQPLASEESKSDIISEPTVSAVECSSTSPQIPGISWKKNPRDIRTGTRDAVKENDGLMSGISCIQAVRDTLGNTLAFFPGGK
jgi:hypothetical protein